jgi:hypothetical protein
LYQELLSVMRIVFIKRVMSEFVYF